MGNVKYDFRKAVHTIPKYKIIPNSVNLFQWFFSKLEILNLKIKNFGRNIYLNKNTSCLLPIRYLLLLITLPVKDIFYR